MLFLDGGYVAKENGLLDFERLSAPDPRQLQAVLERISRRMGRWLERQGLLERDMDRGHLTSADADDSALSDMQAHSLTYRIALGRNRAELLRFSPRLPANARGHSGWPKRPTSPCTPDF
jgi:hypothetical protein